MPPLRKLSDLTDKPDDVQNSRNVRNTTATAHEVRRSCAIGFRPSQGLLAIAGRRMEKAARGPGLGGVTVLPSDTWENAELVTPLQVAMATPKTDVQTRLNSGVESPLLSCLPRPNPCLAQLPHPSSFRLQRFAGAKTPSRGSFQPCPTIHRPPRPLTIFSKP